MTADANIREESNRARGAAPPPLRRSIVLAVAAWSVSLAPAPVWAQTEEPVEEPSEEVDTEEPAPEPAPELPPEEAEPEWSTEPETEPPLEITEPEEEVDPEVDRLLSMSLEDLLNMRVDVISATRTSQTADDAPSIIAVITARDIRQRGYRSVGEALRHVPGIAVIYDHDSYDVGVRGIHGPPGAPNEAIRFMINGTPIAFRSTGSSRVGRDLIPIEAIRQIEILRSPGSALYGANAFLAVVNIVTFDRGTADEPLNRHIVSVEGYLTDNPYQLTFNGAASFFSGMDLGNFHYSLSGGVHGGERSGLRLPGYDQLVRRETLSTDAGGPNGYPSPAWSIEQGRYLLRNGTSRNDTELNASFYGTISYDFEDDVFLQLDGSLQYSERSVEFAYFAPLTHESRLGLFNGFSRLMFSANQNATRGFAGRLSATVSGGMPTGADHIVDRLRRGLYRERRFDFVAVDVAGDLSYSLGPDDASAPSNLKLTVGFELSIDSENLLGFETYDARTNALVEVDRGAGRREFTNLGIYLQGLWNPVEELRFTLGSRIDYNEQIACLSNDWHCFGSRGDTFAVSPLDERPIPIDNRGIFQLSNRLAGVYQLPFLGMFVKLIYSSSFKPPSPFQLYHSPLTSEGSTLGDPSLRPQTADTFELQIGARPVENLYLSVSAFYSYLSNIVRYFNEGSVLRGRNADAELAGIEAEVRYVLTSAGTTFFANVSGLVYDALRPSQLRGETDLEWMYSPFNTTTGIDRYPRFMANIGLNVAPPGGHINFSVLARIVGPRSASLTNNQLYTWNSLASTYELDPYVTFDVTVSTVDLYLLSPEQETVISFGIRGLGTYSEAGFSGIDLPSSGPQVSLRLEQSFR